MKMNKASYHMVHTIWYAWYTWYTWWYTWWYTHDIWYITWYRHPLGQAWHLCLIMIKLFCKVSCIKWPDYNFSQVLFFRLLVQGPLFCRVAPGQEVQRNRLEELSPGNYMSNSSEILGHLNTLTIGSLHINWTNSTISWTCKVEDVEQFCASLHLHFKVISVHT